LKDISFLIEPYCTQGTWLQVAVFHYKIAWEGNITVIQ